MNQKVENEIKKVIAGNGDARVGNSFGSMATRSAELVQFKANDVLEFPESLDGQVVTVPVRGAKDENGEQVYASYIPVSVTRTVGGKEVEKVIPFYPSAFWKRRQECTADGKPIDGRWHNAGGEVAEMVADFATVDEALVAIAQKGKVKVAKVDTFKTLPFGAAEGSKPTNTNVLTFEWA